jgi:hypothetical protein
MPKYVEPKDRKMPEDRMGVPEEFQYTDDGLTPSHPDAKGILRDDHIHSEYLEEYEERVKKREREMEEREKMLDKIKLGEGNLSNQKVLDSDSLVKTLSELKESIKQLQEKGIPNSGSSKTGSKNTK